MNNKFLQIFILAAFILLINTSFAEDTSGQVESTNEQIESISVQVEGFFEQISRIESISKQVEYATTQIEQVFSQASKTTESHQAIQADVITTITIDEVKPKI